MTNKIILITTVVVFLVIGIAFLSGYCFWHEKEIKYRWKMRHVIAFVDSFIEKHGRCPDFHEFDNMNKHSGFALKCDTRYVRSMGGTKPTDYILGYWRSEWHYCYRSWDGRYFDDYDNAIFGN